jgi:hypothetical protein
MRVDTGDDFIEVEGRDDDRNGKEIRDLREVLFVLFCFADASCRAVAESLAILKKRSVPLALSVEEDPFTMDGSIARPAYSLFAFLDGSPVPKLLSLSERWREPYDLDSFAEPPAPKSSCILCVDALVGGVNSE